MITSLRQITIPCYPFSSNTLPVSLYLGFIVSIRLSFVVWLLDQPFFVIRLLWNVMDVAVFTYLYSLRVGKSISHHRVGLLLQHVVEKQ